MIKKILHPIALVMAIVLGGVGADFLRNKAAHVSTEVASANDTSHKAKTKNSHGKKNDHGKKVKKKKKKKKKGGHGAEDEKNADRIDAITYMKFKRQFIVPVMNGGRIQSLVLLSLNLELDGNAPNNVYTLEPKLRDAIMRQLLQLSHEGTFLGDLTSPDTYDKVRTTLLNASQSVIADGVKNILILDLIRQDQ